MLSTARRVILSSLSAICYLYFIVVASLCWNKTKMFSKQTNQFVSVYDVFKKTKRSGNFRRKVKARASRLISGVKKNIDVIVQCPQQQLQQNVEEDCYMLPSSDWRDIDISDDECTNIQPVEQNSNAYDMQWAFKSGLSKWAIECNIPHNQLRSLISMCNETLPFQLPVDPRTLFHTPRSIIVKNCGSNDGLYWHRGLKDCLHSKLKNQTGLPKRISLNVNIDGLPISKSSNQQFWPILFNIHELHSIEPGIVGIFCGIGKKKYTQFLHHL